MAAITVYEDLLTLFRRFGENASGTSTIIEVWRRTLGADDQIVLQTLALLRANLARAMDQIGASAVLDVEDKKVALTAIRQLDDVISPNQFHRRSDEVAKFVTGQKISMLVLLANSMMMEFPEDILAQDEIDRLAMEVDELTQLVRDSNNLNPVFKNRLLGPFGYVKWAVRNTKLAGVDAIYAAFGMPLLLLRREISKATDESDNELEPKRIIHRRMDELFLRIVDHVATSQN